MLFKFEMDFALSLRCVPMIVRMKLDQCGVKLSLRQWSRFTQRDRQALVGRPVTTPPEQAAYRSFLLHLIRIRAGEEPKLLPPVRTEAWQPADGVPDAITMKAQSSGLRAPTPEQWGHLSVLQRFALLKLTRPGHENQKFEPALREFLGEMYN
ncbi:MAG: nitrate reductase associated protein [Komagataeibacter saccharivorans]|uniref:nitrate reductase associated protein n=1 Tax=Komagataeibacter saccharivorans TaxID=265959 RepID=UPI0039E8D330